MRTIENQVIFINTMADAIIHEASKYEVHPSDVLRRVRQSVDNKVTALTKTNDSVDAIRYAVESSAVWGVHSPKSPSLQASLQDMLAEQTNCRCSVEPIVIKAEELSVVNLTPQPKSIIYNNRTTIVIWSDDTKTIVRCADGQEFDEYTGFVAAIAKKMYGSTPKVKKLIDEIKVVQPTKQKKQKQEPDAVADAEETASDEQQISLEELEDALSGSQQNPDNASSDA